MPHTVTYNSETHIVETKAHGNITLDEAKELIFDIGQVCVEKNCFLCLSDYREASGCGSKRYKRFSILRNGDNR
jgi:hypothetical protein